VVTFSIAAIDDSTSILYTLPPRQQESRSPCGTRIIVGKAASAPAGETVGTPPA
jgi:hypothetical protein